MGGGGGVTGEGVTKFKFHHVQPLTQRKNNITKRRVRSSIKHEQDGIFAKTHAPGGRSPSDLRTY